MASFETFLCFKQKFASIPRKRVYSQLQDMSGTTLLANNLQAHHLSSGAFLHPEERFFLAAGKQGIIPHTPQA
jgi:hypothetical protein